MFFIDGFRHVQIIPFGFINKMSTCSKNIVVAQDSEAFRHVQTIPFGFINKMSTCSKNIVAYEYGINKFNNGLTVS